MQPEIRAPVRIALERLIAGGEIRTLEQKEIDGKVIEHVEARLGAKDMEYDVARGDTVLAISESVAYPSFPVDVLATARQCCGAAAKLEVCKEVEHDKIFCEKTRRRTTRWLL